jgi:hypothetical protein
MPAQHTGQRQWNRDRAIMLCYHAMAEHGFENDGFRVAQNYRPIIGIASLKAVVQKRYSLSVGFFS